jgi:hypothetical protein
VWWYSIQRRFFPGKPPETIEVGRWVIGLRVRIPSSTPSRASRLIRNSRTPGVHLIGAKIPSRVRIYPVPLGLSRLNMCRPVRSLQQAPPVNTPRAFAYSQPRCAVDPARLGVIPPVSYPSLVQR